MKRTVMVIVVTLVDTVILRIRVYNEITTVTDYTHE